MGGRGDGVRKDSIGELLVLIVRLEAKKSPGRRQARGVHSMEKIFFPLLMSLGWLMDRASSLGEEGSMELACIVWRVGYRWTM